MTLDEHEDDSPEAVEFRRHCDICFGVIDRAVVQKLIAKGMHPLALANALVSHGATLLGTVDGKAEAAEFLENTAKALRELQEAGEIPKAAKH